MKIWQVILSAVFAVTLTLSGAPADAKRMGGGGSFGIGLRGNIPSRIAA